MEIKTARQGKIVSIGELLPEQLQVPVPFDIVDLTDQERAEAIELGLQQARLKKHNSLESQRKAKLAEQKRNDFKRPFAPDELYKLAKWRATQMIRFRTGNPAIEFEPVAFQLPIITALSLYFSGAEEFERLNRKDYNDSKLDFSLHKGIWLWGNPGVGKSLMMEMFNRNKRLCYDLMECSKICYQYVKYGDDVLKNLITECESIAPDAGTFYQPTKGICYNDLGTEPPASKHYGNSLNVMEYIILQTYERKVPYWQRHVTTNLTFNQVSEIYGVRVLDRIKECFNILEVRGESLRK